MPTDPMQQQQGVDFSKGPFSQAIIPKPYVPEDNRAAQAGWGGVGSALAQMGTEFLKGAAQARVHNYAINEMEKQKKNNVLQGLLQYAESMDLTPTEKREAQKPILSRLMMEVAAADHGAKPDKNNPNDHQSMFDKIKSTAGGIYTSLMGGPMPTKATPLKPDEITGYLTDLQGRTTMKKASLDIESMLQDAIKESTKVSNGMVMPPLMQDVLNTGSYAKALEYANKHGLPIGPFLQSKALNGLIFVPKDVQDMAAHAYMAADGSTSLPSAVQAPVAGANPPQVSDTQTPVPTIPPPLSMAQAPPVEVQPPQSPPSIGDQEPIPTSGLPGATPEAAGLPAIGNPLPQQAASLPQMAGAPVVAPRPSLQVAAAPISAPVQAVSSQPPAVMPGTLRGPEIQNKINMLGAITKDKAFDPTPDNYTVNGQVFLGRAFVNNGLVRGLPRNGILLNNGDVITGNVAKTGVMPAAKQHTPEEMERFRNSIDQGLAQLKKDFPKLDIESVRAVANAHLGANDTLGAINHMEAVANRAQGAKNSLEDREAFAKFANNLKQSMTPTVVAPLPSGDPVRDNAFKRYTPDVQAKANLLLAYDSTVSPRLLSMKSDPSWIQATQLAHEADPSFDAKNFKVQQDMMVNATSDRTGTMGQSVGAINVVMGHIGYAWEAAKALNNKNSLNLLNDIAQKLDVATGKSPTVVYNAIVKKVGDEAVRAYVGSGGQRGDRAEAREDFISSHQPGQVQDALRATINMLDSKVNQVREKWKGTFHGKKPFPYGEPNGDVLGTDALEVYKTIMGSYPKGMIRGKVTPEEAAPAARNVNDPFGPNAKPLPPIDLKKK